MVLVPDATGVPAVHQGEARGLPWGDRHLSGTTVISSMVGRRLPRLPAVPGATDRPDITSHSQNGDRRGLAFQSGVPHGEPELFFPVGTSGPALVQTARAKAVCRRCPVMIQCRTWALTTGQTAGVWGGMSEDERRRDRVDLLLPRGLRAAPHDESRPGTERSGRTEIRTPTPLPQPGKPAAKRVG